VIKSVATTAWAGSGDYGFGFLIMRILRYDHPMVKRDAIQITRDDEKHPIGVSIPARTSEDPYLIKLMEQTKEEERDQLLDDVFRIGSLALLDDRISSLLADADGQIRSRFEQLKVLHELRLAAWERSSNKGKIGEQWVDDALREYALRVGWGDKFTLTGDEGGAIAGSSDSSPNKSGDVLAVTEQGARIAVEVKFTNISEGPLTERDYDKPAPDTAWSQIVEAVANRNADVGFIVFDRANMNPKIRSKMPDIGYLEGAGLVCVVDWNRGQLANLYAAYAIARALAHLPNFSRHPETVAALISQAQAIVKEVATLEAEAKKIIESAKATQHLAHGFFDAVHGHLVKLAAVSDQLNASLDHELTARDQIDHFKGAAITDLVNAHRKDRAAQRRSDAGE
jgi:hypothetical protein